MTFSQGLSDRDRSAIDVVISQLQHQLDSAEDIQEVPKRVDHTNLLVASTIILAVVAVGAITTIFIVRPEKDNTALIGSLLSFLVPLMTALLAAAVQQVHVAVNSRLSQLLRVTAAKSKAEGMLMAQTQLAKLTDTVIAPPPLTDKPPPQLLP